MTGVVVPDFDTLITVAGSTDVDDSDVIVAIVLPTAAGPIDPLEEALPSGVGIEGPGVIEPLLGATGVIPSLEDNGEDTAIEEDSDDDEELGKDELVPYPDMKALLVPRGD